MTLKGEDMNEHLINLGIALASGVVSPLVARRLGGGELPGEQHVNVHGDHNTVTQTLHHTRTITEIYAQLPEPSHQPARGRAPVGVTQSSDDPWVRVAAMLLAAAGLVLAFLFAWPAVVSAFAGAAVGLLVMTAVIAYRTRGTVGPRVAAMIATLVSSGALLLAAWWTWRGGPGHELSFARLEDAISSRYPSYAHGLGGRWDVLVSHPGGMLRAVGWSGFLYVLVQALTVELAALLVWVRARELVGWIALHNLPGDPASNRLAARASRFKRVGPGTVVASVLAAAAVGIVSGGWAATWLEGWQDRSSIQTSTK